MSTLYKCDPTKIKVLTGDLEEGYWELDGSTLKSVYGPKPAKSVELAGNVNSVVIKNELKKDHIEPLFTSFVGYSVGRFVFGMVSRGTLGTVGGVATAVVTHFVCNTRPEVSVRIKLKDGRKFLAVMTSAMYNRFSGMTPI